MGFREEVDGEVVAVLDWTVVDARPVGDTTY